MYREDKSAVSGLTKWKNNTFALVVEANLKTKARNKAIPPVQYGLEEWPYVGMCRNGKICYWPFHWTGEY